MDREIDHHEVALPHIRVVFSRFRHVPNPHLSVDPRPQPAKRSCRHRSSLLGHHPARAAGTLSPKLSQDEAICNGVEHTFVRTLRRNRAPAETKGQSDL